MKAVVVTLALVVPLVLSLALQEDDLIFDDGGEETTHVPVILPDQPDRKLPHPERSRTILNDVAYFGHVFKLKIPKQALPGTVDHYEVQSLPRWLHFDSKMSTLRGLPSEKDVGQHQINLKAYGAYGHVVDDGFTIQVKPPEKKDKKYLCANSEERAVILIYLNANFDDLKPTTRVNAIRKLARYLRINIDSISMHSQDTKEDGGSKLIKSGPGNIKYRKETKNTTVIEWQVSCRDRLEKDHGPLLMQLAEEARDGSLAEVLQLSVLRWQVKIPFTDPLRNRREVAGSGDYGFKNSNDNDEDYDADYEYNYEDGDENEAITELPTKPIVSNVSGLKISAEPESEHPHRHHHGEETWKAEENIDEHDIIPVIDPKPESIENSSIAILPRLTTTQQTTTTAMTTSTPSTTTTITSTTTTTTPTLSTLSTSTENQETVITSSTTTATPMTITTGLPGTILPAMETTKSEIAQETAEATVRTEVTEAVTLTQPMMTVDIDSTSDKTTVSSIVTTLSSPTTIVTTVIEKQEVNKMIPSAANETIDEHSESTEETTIQANTTMVPITTTLATSTIPMVETTITTPFSTIPDIITTTYIPTTTSPVPSTTTTTTDTQKSTTAKVEFGVRNYPPRQDRRLKKIPVTAGKPLTYIIPANTFSDIEDGDTRNLRLSLKLNGNPVKSTHWLQFNSETQEIYGLPLEEDVSVWEYDLVATDREGLEVSDKLDIYVQQHKLSRSVNHEFSIYLRIDKRSEFLTDVDWELKVVRSLGQLYGDQDPSHITVRSIDINGVQAIFTWTNDSIPRSNDCPKDAISNLLHVLIANKDYDPSELLQQALAPEIRVKRVVSQGIGQCDQLNQPDAPETPTQEPKTNFPPLPRNQVDHINATVGQLLIFRVPEDTFYDPEDGSARNMKMSLLTVDRSPIPNDNWLQFDIKNQEFYGVPMQDDIKRKEYQLVVTDKDGASATDGLVVVVHASTEIKPSAEFTIKLGVEYKTFAQSAMQKRNFIEKLRLLFGDKDTSAISLTSISPAGKNTVVTWRNTTLPTSYCPNKEITLLSDLLFVKGDNRGLRHIIERIMGNEFPVDQLTLTPMGICQGEFTRVHSHDNNMSPAEDSTSVGTTHDDYLITFVLPAIIIAAMLILAGIIACVLYKRKRSGKMSVSEHDDERQSFRSKGIPVIFQDELDEKPDPGNKSPVILKEEKPPLPPPEYQKSDDGADQPMLPQENSEPYQPPPPFARNSDNSRQNRPKPTPTYRKPPPYVPP